MLPAAAAAGAAAVAIEEKSAGGKLRAPLPVEVENEYGSYEAPIIAPRIN